jgi:putative restriction endonuclease
MLENYIKAFAKLRTDKGRDRYPKVTLHRAPHKPFLLLSIMDLIAQGQITENFVEPSFELVDTFNNYWSRVMPPGSSTSMAYPFSRLKGDGFWHRVTKPGFDAEIEYSVKSMRRFRQIYLGAKMDEELFGYLCDPKTREHLRAVLIGTYFAPEVRPILAEQGRVNYEAFQYSQKLIKMAESEMAYGGEKEKDPHRQIVRDQAFRKTVVSLYDHRCAMCGIRVMTREGHFPARLMCLGVI